MDPYIARLALAPPTARFARGLLLASVLALVAACGSPPPADGGADGSIMFDVSPMDALPDLQIPDGFDVQVPDVDVVRTDACASGVACNGACVDLQNAIDNCGACGVNCGSLPGVVAANAHCTAGRCALAGACAPGRADCDGNPANGCEADLTLATNCGGCGIACSGGTPMCTMGAGPTGGYGCANGCAAPTPSRCGTTCVDLSSDARNCGMCGLTCSAPTGGTGACVGSVCTNVCPTGQHLCGGACASNTAVATCGGACAPCTAPANATATCDGTACGFACNAGFHRCGDVCVSNAAVTTCGALCAPCTAPAHATATCTTGTCGFTCNPGFADCDRDPANGCEADLNTAAHCGACATTCTGTTPFCTNAGTTPACSNGCSSGVLCSGVCSDTSTDPANCNTCGNACPVPANGRATCAAGTCGIACTFGYHACGGVCVADNDPAHCGALCAPCPTPAGATATCDGTTCGIVCPTGQHSCAGACVSNNDVAHCGNSCAACATDANGTSTCNGAACVLTCGRGYTLRGGACVDIDECAITSGICGRGVCTNVPGTYTCSCDVGYTAPATGGTCTTSTITGYTVASSTAPFLDACGAPGSTVIFQPTAGGGKGSKGDDIDDDVASTPIPFAFRFYSGAFSSVNVSSNGNLQFVSMSHAYSNACLPTAAVTDAILGLWDDLYLDAPGHQICAATFGAPGSRQFVVTWHVRYIDDDASTVTFSTILNESDLTIDVVYQTLSGVEQTATVGVQHDLSASTEYLCNGGGGGGKGGDSVPLGGTPPTEVTAPSSITFTPY